MKADLVISGAGMGGLALAIAAIKAGFTVRVAEQAPEVKEVGAGVTLGPNAMKAVRVLGIEAELREIGFEPTTSSVRDGKTGSVLINFERRGASEAMYDAPYLCIHRADLQKALLDALLALDPEALVTGFTTVHVSGGTLHAADGRMIEGEIVAGCDGVHSAVRNYVVGPGSPRFSGYVAFRGLLDAASLPAGTVDDGTALYIAPGRTAIRYPVRRGALINLACFAELPGWEEEGWSIPAEKAEFAEIFKGFCPEVRTLIDAIEPANLFKWALLNRDPFPNIVKDQVALLGDAAHPVLPFLGQGAALAFEDAVMLTRYLVRDGLNERALAAYQAARLDRVHLVQRESQAAVLRYHNDQEGFYTPQVHRNPDSLNLFSYNAATVAL